MENTETIQEVTISKEEYDELLKSYRWLNCMEIAGVDHWQGLEFARELYVELYGEDE